MQHGCNLHCEISRFPLMAVNLDRTSSSSNCSSGPTLIARSVNRPWIFAHSSRISRDNRIGVLLKRLVQDADNDQPVLLREASSASSWKK